MEGFKRNSHPEGEELFLMLELSLNLAPLLGIKSP